MYGETNGGQEATQGAQDASQQQDQEQQGTVKILAHFPTAP